MSKGIGDILIKLRNETGYTQEQLCGGLCSVSTLARIESNELLPEYFLLDRIFGRLGKSTERLEYVLPGDVYELYELRYKIQAAVSYRKFDEAEELLAEYEKEAGRDISEEEMKMLKKEVHFDEAIEMIADNGRSLSGGQRKKLLMMKLLLKYRTSSVIILDELEAGLDAATKEIVMEIEERIVKEKKDCIIFKITHEFKENPIFTKVVKL